MKLPPFPEDHKRWDRYRRFYVLMEPWRTLEGMYDWYRWQNGPLVYFDDGSAKVVGHRWVPSKRGPYRNRYDCYVNKALDRNLPKLYLPGTSNAVKPAWLVSGGVRQTLWIDTTHRVAVAISWDNDRYTPQQKQLKASEHPSVPAGAVFYPDVNGPPVGAMVGVRTVKKQDIKTVRAVRQLVTMCRAKKELGAFDGLKLYGGKAPVTMAWLREHLEDRQYNVSEVFTLMGDAAQQRLEALGTEAEYETKLYPYLSLDPSD